MSQTRDMTWGNTKTQLSKLKENIANVNPIVAATMRNFVAKNGRSPDANELTAAEERNTISPHKLHRLSDIIANNVTAAEDLRTITPYIDRAELIWSTLLLYPNGKKEEILTYSTRPTKHRNTVLYGILTKAWKEYFTNDYKIEEELNDQINDILWNTGSYATLSLSRISLDYLINGMEIVNRGGKEDLFDDEIYRQTSGNFGYNSETKTIEVMNLGKYVTAPGSKPRSISGAEVLFQSSGVSNKQPEFDLLKGTKLHGTNFKIMVTDNPAVMAFSELNKASETFNEMVYCGHEDYGSIINDALADAPRDGVGNAKETNQFVNTARDIKDDKKKPGRKPDKPEAKTQNLDVAQLNALQSEMFPRRNTSRQFVQYIKQDIDFGVENYGRPIDEKVPSWAIIPVHLDGNLKKKTRYIILIDPDTGTYPMPVTDVRYYSSGKPKTGNTGRNRQGSTNSLIDNLKTMQEGKDCDFDMSEFAELTKQLLVEQYSKSILSGRSGSISIELDEEVNKIFLSRMFKGQSIRCLVVPGECVTYSAFKYNNLGCGQSLVQSAKMQIARIAALDLADTMANMEAAQPLNKMRIGLSKEDPTPENTIAKAREVFYRSNPRFYNVLASNQMSVPVLVDAFRELSLILEIESNDNPYLPAPSVTIESVEKGVFKEVSKESRDEVLNKIANYFLLPRSWLDVYNSDNNFQIEAITENRLVYNQAVNWQIQLCSDVMERERKHARANPDFMRILAKLIVENKKLWKSDDGQEIPGKTDEEKVKFILKDFMNCIICSLPIPAAIETAEKITKNLAVAQDLVEQWKKARAKPELIKLATTAFNLTGVYDDTVMAGYIEAYLWVEAHRTLGIPSPFADAMDDPSGGGLISAVESMVKQNATMFKFVAAFAIRDLEERTAILKKDSKKVDNALEKYQTVGGDDEETPPPAADGGVSGDGDVVVDINDDNKGTDNPEGGDGTSTDDEKKGEGGDGDGDVVIKADDESGDTGATATPPAAAPSNDPASNVNPFK